MHQQPALAGAPMRHWKATLGAIAADLMTPGQGSTMLLTVLTVRSEIVYSDKLNLDFWLPKKRPLSTKPARVRAGPRSS